MKTVKKEVKLSLESVSCDPISVCGEFRRGKYEYSFSTYKPIENIHSITHFVEVEEPETMKEFCEKYNMPKKELVKWLNRNYKL